MFQYQIIKIPSCLGAPKPGTHKGPDKIIDYLKKKSLNSLRDLFEVKIPSTNN